MTTEQQLIRWKRIAAYLASCHAATAEGLPKSVSGRQKKRHAAICEKAAKWMASDWMSPDYARPDGEEVLAAIKRCEDAVSALANVVMSQPSK